MMRVLAISAALVSGEIDWTASNIYAILSSGYGLIALNLAAGADDDACAAEAAAFLNTDATNTAKATGDIVCDAATEAAAATLIKANIGATLNAGYAPRACANAASAKTVFSNVAAALLFPCKATICPADGDYTAYLPDPDGDYSAPAYRPDNDYHEHWYDDFRNVINVFSSSTAASTIAALVALAIRLI